MTNASFNPATVPATNVSAYSEQQSAPLPYAGISAPEATVLMGCITCIFLVIGWIYTHRTALKREREARAHADKNAREDRMRLFEGFLVEKEQIAEASTPDDVFRMYFSKDGWLNSGFFRKEAVKVRRDFPIERRSEFDRLDEALSRMSPSVLRGVPPKTSINMLTDAIRDMLKFIRAA
jgi:hypothetical protein